MKKLFALLILLLMVAMTGCGNINVRMDAGMAVRPDGGVSVKSRLLSVPMAQGELLKVLKQSFAPQTITPLTAGELSGYEGVSDYKTITDMAKTNALAKGLSAPEKKSLCRWDFISQRHPVRLLHIGHAF